MPFSIDHSLKQVSFEEALITCNERSFAKRLHTGTYHTARRLPETPVSCHPPAPAPTAHGLRTFARSVAENADANAPTANGG